MAMVCHQYHKYRKLLKIRPPFCTLLWGKSGEGGICLNTRIILCILPPPVCFLLCLYIHEVNHCENCRSFLEEQQLGLTCNMNNQLVLILSREALKQLASSVVIGDETRKLAFPMWAEIPWWIHDGAQYWAFTWVKIYLCKIYVFQILSTFKAL